MEDGSYFRIRAVSCDSSAHDLAHCIRQRSLHMHATDLQVLFLPRRFGHRCNAGTVHAFVGSRLATSGVVGSGSEVVRRA